ncbi:hypermethylated in cancer 2 protein isoform X2 [Cephus cinctus]|uniref:Hypermethylated in cancer 2 protein isoform X2 n=1 Tax=Cephus cinctus TaxID=211228 RepID=A0AAJ7BYG8_CEPCN|nr:hypermethylated in cancer 2 protein isoform X2 [Cephus cinctus]
MEVEVIEVKDLGEILNQAEEGEEIIFESEATEDGVDEEVEEIVEIIEEIEEVEEDVDEEEQHDLENSNGTTNKSAGNSTTEMHTKVQSEESGHYRRVYSSGKEFAKKSTQKHLDNGTSKVKKQHVTYDVDEDWEDEDADESESRQHNNEMSQIQLKNNKKTYNISKKSVNMLNSENTGTSSAEEVILKANKSGVLLEYDHSINDAANEENSGHEIVKNTENNLVYTVLGSKKSVGSSKGQEEKNSGARFLKVDQIEDNAIPVEGTIYYEGEEMQTLYVAHSVNDNEQYQYEGVVMEQEGWETASQEEGSQQQQQQEEENSQDQIFLHEDEDGQLYFKDDTGTLQPVYLTADGNYAIAEASSDDQDSQESQSHQTQNSRSSDDGNCTAGDMEYRNNIEDKQDSIIPSSSLSEMDNEDNTVTISLIISEDEHGQKRTQVIIPTTDTLKCEICNKSFKTSFQLLRHNRLKHAREEDITTRNFPCDLCPKRYPDQNSLARHRKTHTGDRPFQCLECHKNFPTSTALRRHLTLHNPQSRPLPCIYCGRRFLEKASLAKHEQSHLAGDQRTHTCDICHKSFMHASDLNLHKKNHDPDKKFDCEQGANEEILSCDVCGITYKFMSSLTRHMVTTHMNPEKLRQQAEEQRRKRENNYRRYLENRKMYETQHSGSYGTKRGYHHNSRVLNDDDDIA